MASRTSDLHRTAFRSKAPWGGLAPALLGAGTLAALFALAGDNPPRFSVRAATITTSSSGAPGRGSIEPSSSPTDGELRHAGLFDEPLVPSGQTSPDENRALAATLRAYQEAVTRSGARDRVQPITDFLAQRAGSAWTATLLLHLGGIYRQTGHLSKALATWQQAWDLTKYFDDADGRALGDSAGANLSQFEAYLGRKELLAPLLDELKNRPVHGSAAELISESSRGLAEMRSQPESSFKCGPFALYRINLYQHPNEQLDPKLTRGIFDSRSTADGLSLPQVQALSQRVGMSYQMAFRSPGAEMILPAVTHWKVGHYAAVVDRLDARYLVEDSTFGENIRVDAATLDEEASGYFLVPPGALPVGWRNVSVEEGSKVWGRGNTGSNKDNAATGPCDDAAFPCNVKGGGYTTWNVHAMVVGLSLADIPLGYTPPVGPPMGFGMFYAHRDVQQPAVFNYTNFGNKWTTSWLSYVTDNYAVNTTATLYGRGGGAEPYTFTSATLSSLAPFTQATLTRQIDGGGATTGFSRQLLDGTVEQFNQPLGSKFFLTALIDPQGNKVSLTYDAQTRLVSLTDAIGQVTQLSYDLATDPLKVTQVTDPFGRSATFTYAADGHLASITDVLGITSQYTYDSGDFITTLTTPYGTTAFTYGDSTTDATLGPTRFVTITDALGRTSRVEFHQAAPGILTSDPIGQPQGISGVFLNDNLEWRNTFIWGPTQLEAAMSSGTLDYTKARIIHWDHTTDGTSTSRVIESLKDPLENRVWYYYPNQPAPNVIGNSNEVLGMGRVLDDTTFKSELLAMQYDAFGNLISSTDAAGRQYTFTYDPNGIDLLTFSNTTAGTTDLLATLTYNGQHRPVSITDTSGQMSTIVYNAQGQQTKITDALGNATTYTYDAQGYLTGTQGPLPGATFVFTYDSAGGSGSIPERSASRSVSGRFCGDCTRAAGMPMS